jgi:hypothetical protein
MKIAEMGELGELEHALTPSALFALESFFGRYRNLTSELRWARSRCLSAGVAFMN